MRAGIIKYILGLMLLAGFVLRGAGQPPRAVPDSAVQALKVSDDFRYANDSTFWQTSKANAEPAWIRALESISNSKVLKWLLYLVIAALAVFILYQIITVNNFFAPRRRKQRAGVPEEGEEHPPDNIDESLAAAIAAGEYRLAVRFLYLKTLQALDNGKKIRLRAGSTNRDYLQQLQADPAAATFRDLTGWYEYVWYGGFQPNAAQFQRISQHFNQFNSQW